jgi:hypothetical protein
MPNAVFSRRPVSSLARRRPLPALACHRRSTPLSCGDVGGGRKRLSRFARHSCPNHPPPTWHPTKNLLVLYLSIIAPNICRMPSLVATRSRHLPVIVHRQLLHAVVVQHHCHAAAWAAGRRGCLALRGILARTILLRHGTPGAVIANITTVQNPMRKPPWARARRLTNRRCSSAPSIRATPSGIPIV